KRLPVVPLVISAPLVPVAPVTRIIVEPLLDDWCKSLSLAIVNGPFRQREPHLKTCVAGFRTDLNRAPMLLHNSQCGVESEACALADCLSSKEGLKDVRLNVGRNSRTIVGDFNHHAIVFAIGSHSKFAFAAHRVDSVVDNVGPHLIQFATE